MEYRVLGRSDLRVSSIGLGCVTFGREIDTETSHRVLDRAFERGINLLDTAEAYANGGSEEVLGQWLASRGARGKVILATKVRPPLTRERLLASVEASLRRLQTDTIDLFQLHAWDPNTQLDETLDALDTLVRQGKVRYLGCSNLAAWQLCKALWWQNVHGWARMEAVQPCYNLVVRDIERELLPLCADQQVGVISFSPLGGGFLSGKYRPGKGVPAGARLAVVPGMQPIYLHDAGFRIVAGLRARAEQLGCAMPTLALAWAMRQPGITAVLIGARTPEHVDQALAADAFAMTRGLCEELAAL